MSKRKPEESKEKPTKYLTVHVRPSKTLKRTVQVSIPLEFWDAEGLPAVIRTAVAAVQSRTRQIERAH